MLKRLDVDEIERLIGQLDGHHSEVTALTKKSPNDAVNDFKLKFINTTIVKCNHFLGEQYKPFIDFSSFDSDDVPSNSDVTFILAQYKQAIEKLRSDNVYREGSFWYYRLEDSDEKLRTAPPLKIK